MAHKLSGVRVRFTRDGAIVSALSKSPRGSQFTVDSGVAGSLPTSREAREKALEGLIIRLRS